MPSAAKLRALKRLVAHGVDEGDLQLLGKWNRGREAFWTVNLSPFKVDIERFKPEAGGWYDPWMVDEIFGQFWGNRWWDPEKEEIVGDREASGWLVRPYRKPWDDVLESLHH